MDQSAIARQGLISIGRRFLTVAFIKVAMHLVHSSRNTDKNGKPKIVTSCTLPLTGKRVELNDDGPGSD